MKQVVKTIILILIIAVMGTGCAWDAYKTVPTQTARVIVKRPFAAINRTAGVEVPAALKVGQRNHGNGPTVAYDIPITMQTETLQVNVKAADNINVPVTFTLTYRVNEAAVVDLALNYMPADMFMAEDLSGMNAVQIWQVPMTEIYRRNILPYFDMVARDVTDNFRSKDIEPGALGAAVKDALIKELENRKIPRTVLKNGVPVYDPSQTIAITEVLDMQSVSVPQYENPATIQEVISSIEGAKSDIMKLQQKKKQMETRRLMQLQQAYYDRQIALKTREELKANPNMAYLHRYHQLDDAEKNAEEGDNTRIIFAPKALIDSGALKLDLTQ